MENKRGKEIVRVSVIGIVVNILLSISKAIVGFLTNSIAIMMDSLNYLSDSVSSIITIIGTKIALKTPDKEHPFGHGRVEYLASLIISIIIMYAGITAFIESIQYILKNQLPEYNTLSLIILAVSVVAKIILGEYYKSKGKKLKSDTLYNSGVDAKLDALVSIATIVSAVIYLTTKVSLEPYLALLISFIIIRSGFLMVKETVSLILGRRIERDLALKIKEIVNSFSEVMGCFDLVVNNYGPERLIASFHIEVDERMTAVEIDNLTRKITSKVYLKTGVIVSAVGIYSMNSKNKALKKIKESIQELVNKTEGLISMHGFYVNEDFKTIDFDVVVSFDYIRNKFIINDLKKKVKEMYPEYKVFIVKDYDVSD